MRIPRWTMAIVAAGVGAILVAWALRPRLAAVRQAFGTSSSPGARAYELLAGPLLDGYYRDVAADCARALDGVPDPRILEVGPGPGHLAERLLAIVPTARWTGLDIDPAMLAATGRRLERAGLLDRATPVEGDVGSLPFPDASFDLVVSSFSVHHWPDAAAGLREIRRVLRVGCIALLYDLPSAWGRMETGSRGLDVAAEVFPDATPSRVRGLGPVTLVARVEARRD